MIRRTGQEISVSLASGSYPIGAGWLPTLGERHRSVFEQASRIFLVSDQQVMRLHGGSLCRGLADSGFPVEVLEIPPGEGSKSLAEATHLWESLLAMGADRRALIVALGGGVVGDLAGFVAATYARGIPYLQVPTTLVAQVDSSIGGKVGINLPAAKNMVGCFWQPQLVAIDVHLLETLPTREYVSGWGEVVKYGMALDQELFSQLEDQVEAIHARQTDVLADFVARCCAIKARIVSDDERDLSGQRAILNYGHTFAHAIETCSGYSEWLHGEAVAMGMHCAARLAQRMNWIDQALVERQAALLKALNLPIYYHTSEPRRYLEAMMRDKKTERALIRCVLPCSLGKARLCEGVDANEILAIWSDV